MRPAEQDSFVQHATDVTVAGHAAGTGTADLRDAADGLRVVLGDRFADFALGDVQTMTDRPMGFGVNVILGESLLTEGGKLAASLAAFFRPGAKRVVACRF